jgi:hypothetical protein
MSVRREKRRDPSTGTVREFWFVDVDFVHMDGRKQRGAEQYERELRQRLTDGRFQTKEESVEVPTLAVFAKEFVAIYAKTNNKPSEVEAKRIALDNHLIPQLGARKLSEIGIREIERFKAHQLAAGYAAKTVNNHLSILRRLLVVAVEWGKLEHVPIVKWLKTPEPAFDFLAFEEAERLLSSAEGAWRVMILTGLHAGLRQGE